MDKMDVASASSSLRFRKDPQSAKKRRLIFRSYSDADARPTFSMTMRLKMVLGMTYPASNCITVHPESGTCAYTASNAVVLFDTINARQIGYMKECKQPLATIRFSNDGKYLVTGGSGHLPPVCVWEVAHRLCVAMLYGHEFGIKCVAFSPRMDLIVSVGNIFDGFIYIWGWPHREKLAANRFAEEIVDVAFSSDSSFFVTCGVHHIKFWYPQPGDLDRSGKRRSPLSSDSVLYGRPAVLGNIKMSHFMGVVCGTQRTAAFVYIINTTGHVGLLSSGMRDIIKLKCLGKKPLSSIAVKDDTLIVAAKDGNIYFCNALSLEVVSNLSPKAVHGESLSLSSGFLGGSSHISTFICYDHIHTILSVFSTGGKLTIWNVRDPHNIIKILYIYNHCGGITGSDILPLKSKSNKKREVLVTVAADATIRLWGLDVSKTVCCDGVTIMSTDLASAVDDIDFSLYNNDENIQGDLLTACKMCDDFIATGDNQGNVVAYSMSDLKVVACVKHHVRAVSCVEIFTSNTSNHRYLLSGGRDRRIVMYDLNDKLKVLSTTNLHSGTITVLRVFEKEGRILLISCGLDRSMVLSASNNSQPPSFSVCFNRCLASSIMDCVFHYGENTIGFGTINGDINVFSMNSFAPVRIFRSSNNINTRVDKIALDSKNNLLLAACSDRTINALNYLDGKILAITSSHNVSGLYFSINNRCFISTSTDGCIFVWGLSTRVQNKPLVKSSSLELRSLSSKKNLSSGCIPKLDMPSSFTRI